MSGGRRTGGGQSVEVDGRRVRISSLDKVVYPETGTTKAEVIDYYRRIASVMIPQAARRPATRKRWVDGVGTQEDPAEAFFRKDLEDSAPDWVPRARIAHKQGEAEYPLIDEPAVLIWLAQLAALEIHTPQWRFEEDLATPANPDRLVLDLDPGEGVSLADCAEVALWCREVLEGMGLPAFPVTSGSKGIHLYAPLPGSDTAEDIDQVAHALAKALEADHPDRIVSEQKKTLRAGKVLVDWSQNNGSKTTITPYSLRGRFRPTVAAPRTWEEIEEAGSLRHLELEEVLERVEGGLDPIAELGWGARADAGPSTPPDIADRAAPSDRRGGSSGPARSDGRARSDGTSRDGSFDSRSADERLATYRSMRDAAKTPEPVPEPGIADRAKDALQGEAPMFVIQEHHATALHWDFRLQHSGVLVSWAVPKGPPLETDVNRLAVQTEDHPLEYGTFEGTIPKGEYGGGEVAIWDAGTIEIEKWREGKEVIVVCHGAADGGLGGVPRRYAFIHTGGMGRASSEAAKEKAQRNWLLHLMKDQPEAGEGGEKTLAGGGSGSRPDAGGGAGGGTGSDGEGSGGTGNDGENNGGSGQIATDRTAPRDLPDAIAPMLATLGTRADIRGEGEWAFEMKWDGVRAIVTLQDDQIRVTSRNGHDVTAAFPELQELTGAIAVEIREAGPTVLDGEIVALDDRDRPRFSLLQRRLGLRDPSEVEKAAQQVPAHLMLFDLLQRGGDSLLRTPYLERREALFETVSATEHVQIPHADHGDVDHAIELSKELQLEGVMAKKESSVYLPGRRTRTWIKLKNARHQEVVVIGWRHGKGGRAGAIGSLLVAVLDADGTLHYAGRVGSGFSDRQLEEIRAMLEARARKTPPVDDVPAADRRDAEWVRADLVGEVQYAERTDEGRLRHPVWRGWRKDKDPEEVRWEE